MGTHEPSVAVRPGPIGRGARVLLGLVLLRLAWGFATGFEAVAQPGNVVLYVWAAVGAFSHVLGTLVPPLLQGRLRLSLVTLAFAGALAASRVVYHAWWGPPLAWVLYLLALAGMAILGIEFVLAGIVGQIGCEKTVIPNLLRRTEEPRVESCALWDPIDRWERKLRQGEDNGDG